MSNVILALIYISAS